MLKLAGTYRSDRHDGAYEPDAAAPDAPQWLRDDTAREVWAYLCEHIAPVLSRSDRDHMAAYCNAVSLYVEAEEDLRREGKYQTNSNTGLRTRNPAAIERDKGLENMRKFGCLFGLSPADRAKIQAPEKPEKDELAALLNA